MKKILAVLASLGLSGSLSTSIIACNPEQKKDKSILETFQINTDQTGIEIFNNLHTFMQILYDLTQDLTATKIATYQVWYQNSDISKDDIIKVAKDHFVEIIVTLALPDENIAIDQGNLITEGFKLGEAYHIKIAVTDVNKQDIKTVSVGDLRTPADQTKKYIELNSNEDIISAVIRAINDKLEITASKNDFTISNDYDDSNEMQKPDVKVTFTITATANSSLIQGTFSFTNTLSEKKDISNIIISNLSIVPNVTEVYAVLNKNKEILDAIIATINNNLEVAITINDFRVNNNRDENNEMQQPGEEVIFNVTANANSNIITGTFNFTIILTQLNLKPVQLTGLTVVAKTDETYEILNQKSEIIDAVIDAVKESLALVITKTDFELKNNKNIDEYQETNANVIFTVTASTDSVLITGSFTFNITLTETK